jgi:hypothetical protein
MRSSTGIPYAVVMVWAANNSAGHTKKTTVIAMYHIGYGLGNILSPQLFQPRWKPRYIPTWWIILWVGTPSTLSPSLSSPRPPLLLSSVSLQARTNQRTPTQLAVILPSIIITVLYFYLIRENKRRDALAARGDNAITQGGIVEETTSQGDKVAHAVDNNQLDLTDRENLTL